MNGKVIIAATIIVVVVGIGICYLILHPAPTPEVAPQIVSHTSYLTEVDYIKFFTVVGEVQNNLKTNIESVKIVATFYNSENDVIGTRFTYTELKIIEPGQKAPFEAYLLLNSTTDVPARYELTLSYVKTSEETVARLEVVNRTSSIDKDGYCRIEGEVQNNGARKAFSVKILCTYYDSEGKVIAVSHAYVSSEMDIGDKAPFELSSKPHKISPASYELLVVAHHYGPSFIAYYQLLIILIAALVAFIAYMKHRGW